MSVGAVLVKNIFELREGKNFGCKYGFFGGITREQPKILAAGVDTAVGTALLAPKSTNALPERFQSIILMLHSWKRPMHLHTVQSPQDHKNAKIVLL